MTARDGDQVVIVIESLDQPIELPGLAERYGCRWQDSATRIQGFARPAIERHVHAINAQTPIAWPNL